MRLEPGAGGTLCSQRCPLPLSTPRAPQSRPPRRQAHEGTAGDRRFSAANRGVLLPRRCQETEGLGSDPLATAAPYWTPVSASLCSAPWRPVPMGSALSGLRGRQAMPHRGFNWFSGSSSLRPCEMSSLQYLDTPFPGKKQVTGWLIS